ncbi:cysteine dioxygenase [Reyranella sp. CPCC 100927]|uniref:cysteine dioxygenase family protein n=1 Tax=Reyranella sp. CPCC 100927 TaxID=2599616 RepID=UPI0011B37AC9|nr:cysteine dioxygenase [Reyranella sp. CPCC 100927]TWT10096.1 cysteine dioxygenase [Reyranella sp. CPCC 100927]
MTAPNYARLRRFLSDMTSLVGGAKQDQDEAVLIEVGGKLVADLVAHDDWLPEEMAAGVADGYRQHLLYCDPQERFSLVSFVWGPGALTPVHDHTVWGLIGMLRGSEVDQRYQRDPATGQLCPGPTMTMVAGDVAALSPTLGDIHQVRNAFTDRTSISVHVYGGNIGSLARHRFDLANNREHAFVSGYSNAALPNIWDRSRESAAGRSGR